MDERQYASWRSHVVTQIPKGSLCALPREVLRSIEIFPGIKLGDEEIVVPGNLVPPRIRNLRQRTVRPALALDGLGRNGPPFDDGLHSIQIIIGAALLIPRTSRRRRGYLPKPSTWIQFCRRLSRFTHWVVENRPNDNSIFSHLTTEDCLEAVGNTSREIGWMVSEVTKLRSLHHIMDWPDLSLNLDDVYSLVDMQEKVRRSAPGVTTPSPRDTPSWRTERRRFQPLPDIFVTECGWRVLWFVEHLGPNILGLMEALGKVPAGIAASRKRRFKWEGAVIAQWRWTDRAGRQITDLPFPIRLGALTRPDRFLAAVQITRLSHVRALLRMLQIAHFHIVSMCLAGRISEVLSLRIGSVMEVHSPVTGADPGALKNRATGVTYKLAPVGQGTVRDWPLHPLAARAIRQQEVLAHLLGSKNGGPLWVITQATVANRTAGEEARDINIGRLVKDFFLEELMDDDGLHHHRYRKTVARLIALAVVGAPKVLMDFFGHKSIWMTLDYILSDPDIAAEIEQVVNEMVQLDAEAAVKAGGGHGGVAGRKLNDFLSGRAGRGEVELGVSDLAEAAGIISLNQKSWLMIRKGIVCTKSLYQVGPCTRGTGLPDTSRCRVGCPERFEHAAARADAERAIQYLVEKLASIADWQTHQARYFIGQLRYQLLRFDDLRLQWENHEVVRLLSDWEDQHLRKKPA